MARRKKIRTTTLVPDTVRKPSGLKADGTPNAYWRRFKERLDQFEQVEISNWAHEEVLGYLLKRYREHYKIDFSLSYHGAPTKCPEIYCVKRMMTTVGTEKGWIIKQYIDWVFDTNIVPNKTQITSLAYFFTAGLCNRFKAEFRSRNQLTKTTPLPDEYKNVADGMELSANTYGDLAFVKMALDQSPEDYPEWAQYFQSIKQLGFDEAILDGLGA